jgi:antitoxin component of MazEF toxin-antitoxin module
MFERSVDADGSAGAYRTRRAARNDSFISMEMHGPRAVIPSVRRVCLPKKLAKPLGLTPGEFARVGVSPHHDGELVVSAAPAPEQLRRSRDPHRARRVTALAQLSLPAALLDAVGVTQQDPWVYFAASDDGRALRVIPAARVDMRVTPRPGAQVLT